MSFTKGQLLPGETLVILARQHALTLFWPVFLNILALALLIGISFYSQNAWFMALDLIPLIYLVWKYLAWHGKEYILTDRRVVKQEGVFNISSFDATLDKINNIYHQQSFVGRLLGYGEVRLETASEQGTTVFDFLPGPVEFKNAIVHQRELHQADLRTTVTHPQVSVPQLIEDLASLRDRRIITESEFQEKKRALLEKL